MFLDAFMTIKPADANALVGPSTDTWKNNDNPQKIEILSLKFASFTKKGASHKDADKIPRQRGSVEILKSLDSSSPLIHSLVGNTGLKVTIFSLQQLKKSTDNAPYVRSEFLKIVLTKGAIRRAEVCTNPAMHGSVPYALGSGNVPPGPIELVRISYDSMEFTCDGTTKTLKRKND